MYRLLRLDLREVASKLLVVALIVLLGAALALLPWKVSALLVVGAALLFSLLIWPQSALCLLAFAVPFGAIREWPLGPVNVGSVELLTLLLLVSWLARMVVERRIIIPRPPLLLPLLLLIAALLLSTQITSSLELSVKEIAKWLEVLLIYLFVDGVVDERWGRWVVWSLLAAGSAEALFGIYQFLRRVGPEGFVLFGRFMRAYGHFAQPNPFAGYLGLTLPLAYAMTLEALEVCWLQVRRARAGIRHTLVHTLAYVPFVASFAVLAAAMVMSWSRGGWVGAAAALVVITLVRSRAALISAIAVGLLVTYLLLAGGAQYLPATLVQRVSDFVPYLGGVDVTRVDVTDANWAVIERMAHWLAAVGMFSDHPWLGVGIGNYAVVYPQYALGRWRAPLGHAHNYYLNIAAEAGIVGLSAYLILFGACFVQAWRVLQRTRSAVIRGPRHSPASSAAGRGPALDWPRLGYWRGVTLGALGVLVHLSVHNLFDNLFVHSMNVQLGLVLGLLVVAQKTAEVDHANRY
jgi:putative inorganic carbon (HCO3(-)) transporter